VPFVSDGDRISLTTDVNRIKKFVPDLIGDLFCIFKA